MIKHEKGGLNFYQLFSGYRKLILLNFILIFTIVPLFGQSFIIDKISYKITGATTVEVTGSNFYDEKDSINLLIPSNVSYLDTTYSVTTIGKHAFTAKTMLISVSIPSTVHTIGESAFNSCSKLATVNIPSSVTVIEEGAFMYCTSLLSITIPPTVKSIQEFTFMNCWSLTSIIIPTSIKSIEQSAFSSCESLTDITIPESVSSIGFGAFHGCRSLKSIYIPHSVIVIPVNAFLGCSGLVEVYIPNSVRSIRGSAFSSCNSLQSISFSVSSNSVPATISLDSIGSFAFSGCDRLKKFSIPATVTSIGYGAFSDTDLTEVYSFNPLPIGFTDPLFSGSTRSYGILYVPTGSINIYKSTIGWEDFKNIVEIGATGVSDEQWIGMDLLYHATNETLQLRGTFQSARVELYNSRGMKLSSCSLLPGEQVSIMHLPKGIYVAKVSTKETTISKKIAKG